jgi:hypothetical protein
LADYLAEVYRILDKAKEDDVEVRLLGSTAFRIHCPKNQSLFDSMKRELTDIDFAASGQQRKKIKELLPKLGYDMDQRVLLQAEGTRFYFNNRATRVGIDVFFEKLEMCHTIEFKDRLKLDYPTVPLPELLLEKMQIVKINEKDIKDTAVVLLEHDLGREDREKIDSEYISRLLSKDWGFYYTVMTNLEKVRKFLREAPYFESLTTEQKDAISARIDRLRAEFESAPKSLRWKLRARVGTSQQWYNDVELDKRTAFQD